MARTRVSSLIVAGTVAAGVASDAGAAAYERRIYTTRTSGTDTPRMDGVPNEECWNLVEWASDFVQWEPTEGEKPSYQTAFKMLYDDHALYIAYRASDPEPHKIADYLTRRDRFPGDWVEVNIDSHHDLRTGFSFTSSVSGTRGDEFISEDGDNWNGNWDPIWQLTTHIDAEGWTAELMIPLSQLRFSNAEEQIWGLQVQRRLFRKEERSLWQPKSKSDSGWVSRFGELRGLRGIKPSRQVELLPYAVAKGERFESIPGDPFQDGSSGDVQAGLDGKVGVTHDLTLDFTVNPDFGQVEADPSQINLTAFETRFEEKRPFFIEGGNILSFQLAPSIAGGNFTQDNLFYSRRIGRAPHGYPDLGDSEYADVPPTSKILAAFKMSGKTEKGLSVGLLESVTAKEEAEIDSPTGTRDEAVEPATNYFLTRLQKDLRKGGTRIGGMFTATNRDITTPGLDFLHSAAYTGGVDLYHSWWNKAWYAALNGAASSVEGSTDALLSTQTSSARYFQRPDNDYESVDSTRTSLQGHAGSFRLGRVTGAGLRFESGVAWRSPGFEINDAGFMQRADEVNQFSWVGWASRNPFSIFRRVGINGNQWLNWDFGGNPTVQQVNTNFNMNFVNQWAMGAGVTYSFESLSNTMLRGGPSALKPRQSFANVWVNSDQRRRVYTSFGGSVGVAAEDSYDYREAWMDLSWLPQNALRITLSPFYSTEKNELQYVDELAYGADPRYLFGSLDQETFGLTARIDFTVTPNLTVQYYGAPFVSAGSYNEFKRITSPRADAYRDRFHTFGPTEIRHNAASDSLLVDENGDGAVDYGFPNPDFDFRDFNSNLVVRWEFQPGSTVYVVWQQARSETVPHGTFSVHNDLGGLFDVHPHNVFLIKVNKWFSL
jgi:hypothetical protein